MRSLLWLAALTLPLSAKQAAALTFEFTYKDDGVGFDDPQLGSARRAALERAGQIFGDTAFGAYDETITVLVDGSETGDLLASAASAEVDDAPTDGGFGQMMIVRHKILFGEDRNGREYDAEISWNFGDHEWQLDIDVTPSEDEYDFYSTVYHELTHAVGWADSLDFPSGRDVFNVGVEEPGQWHVFDSFLSDAAGNLLIDPVTYLNTCAENFEDIAQGGVAQGIFFSGENAVAANDGLLVPLYTPTFFEQGSSVSHLDDDADELAGLMMLSASDTGTSTRLYSDIALGVLQDLGYEDIQQIGE